MSQQDWHLLSSYAGILTLATFSVYTGSFGSLKSQRSKKEEKETSEDDASDSDTDDEESDERLTSSEAIWFPILGSITLFGLYLVVKVFGEGWINWLLGWYFTFAGVASVWRCSICLSKSFLGRKKWNSTKKWTIYREDDYDLIAFRTPSLLLLIPSLIPSFLYSFLSDGRKSALISNILALSFAYVALSVLKLDKFRTGTILLSGLFLYDIWWVFGTEVMVKVATSLDLPIKIVWPKSYLFSTERGVTMLGLGDIVIPGTFASLALRFDLSNSVHKTPHKPFEKPYFTVVLIAYVLGLITTISVMNIFNTGQPALLYLSPACILSFLLTAYARNELMLAWNWEDGIPTVKEPKEKGLDIDKRNTEESTSESSTDSDSAEESLRRRRPPTQE